MILFLNYYFFVINKKIFKKINNLLDIIWFYRHPIFHNYLALVYFLSGVNTILYLLGISNSRFVIQLGMFSPVSGQFWYDVFPEFIKGTLESKRLAIFSLHELFDWLVLEEELFFCYNFFIYFMSWVI